MADDRLLARRRVSAEAEDFHGGLWLFGHLMVFLALLDAFVFRDLLIPELVATEGDITLQVRRLTFCALAIALPLLLAYAVTRRTARARAHLYHLGAWIFFGVTIYLLVQDYQDFGEPGSFTARLNLAIGRVERIVGLDLPRLE
jgi:hypothetical protein